MTLQNLPHTAAFALAERHFGQVMSAWVPVLRRMCMNYSEEQIEEAFDRAVEHGAKSVKYVDTVLRERHGEGFGRPGKAGAVGGERSTKTTVRTYSWADYVAATGAVRTGELPAAGVGTEDDGREADV